MPGVLLSQRVYSKSILVGTYAKKFSDPSMLSYKSTAPPPPDNQDIQESDRWSKRRVKTVPEEDRTDN